MEAEDLSLDAADLNLFMEPSDQKMDETKEEEIFHECSPTLLNANSINSEKDPMQQCSTILDVSSVKAPLSHQTVLVALVGDAEQ